MKGKAFRALGVFGEVVGNFFLNVFFEVGLQQFPRFER